MDFVLSKLNREGVIGWLIGILMVILGAYVTSVNTQANTNQAANVALNVRITAVEQKNLDLDAKITGVQASMESRLARIETKLDELLERK